MQKDKKIEKLKQRELSLRGTHDGDSNFLPDKTFVLELYKSDDFTIFQHFTPPHFSVFSALKTLDELLEQDNQREKDGFLKRIRLGKILKPLPGNKAKVIVVPSTYEPKFYHDNSITEEEEGNATGRVSCFRGFI